LTIPGYTAERGWREVIGGIVISSDALLLSSYDALTMAAQFDDCVLPPAAEQHQILEVIPGKYRVRIVQMYDPNDEASPAKGLPHFMVE
jgi:hypothetical protein